MSKLTEPASRPQMDIHDTGGSEQRNPSDSGARRERQSHQDFTLRPVWPEMLIASPSVGTSPQLLLERGSPTAQAC
ncbi:hypothetical protein KMZ29_24875 [Bradyrhizobium sediminis]|uniref:Uncharacterized protein n=1 Tax=Bradyrhizobium sediminis TaxID=2840469 RepID=A0A975NE31_9BRAD|nr:hypothetical protein [Bradyrhizobium sediminis]QWG12881.1 hypothetical protein KMZ29_24875 [Bradyrhizobium sediminis]